MKISKSWFLSECKLNISMIGEYIDLNGYSFVPSSNIFKELGSTYIDVFQQTWIFLLKKNEDYGIERIS